MFRDGDEVELGSRNERPLTRYFPELLEPIRRELPERVRASTARSSIAARAGLDFDALQQRIHPAESRVRRLARETPASFVAFDLLAVGDDDLMSQPFAERRGRLETRAARAPPARAPDAGRPRTAHARATGSRASKARASTA